MRRQRAQHGERTKRCRSSRLLARRRPPVSAAAGADRAAWPRCNRPSAPIRSRHLSTTLVNALQSRRTQCSRVPMVRTRTAVPPVAKVGTSSQTSCRAMVTRYGRFRRNISVSPVTAQTANSVSPAGRSAELRCRDARWGPTGETAARSGGDERTAACSPIGCSSSNRADGSNTFRRSRSASCSGFSFSPC